MSKDIDSLEMSKTITVNGLRFKSGSLGDISCLIATVAHEYDATEGNILFNALLLVMEDPQDKEEPLRFMHGNDEFDLGAEEELSLAYYLAARNPDEVRRFLDGLGGGACNDYQDELNALRLQLEKVQGSRIVLADQLAYVRNRLEKLNKKLESVVTERDKLHNKLESLIHQLQYMIGCVREP